MPGVDFFECPLWSQPGKNLKVGQNGVVWQDHEGYIYRFGSRVPEKLDVIFLVYLLFQCRKSVSGQAIRVSRYQVLRDCGLKMNSQYYARLVESLARWHMVRIDFSGTFYNGKSYRHLTFGVFDRWEIDEDTRHLKVEFSPLFVEMISGKRFFERIDFPEFKQLRSPLATSLYGVLTEALRECDSWVIDAIELAKQLSMQERYPAHIIPKITAALTRINACKALGFEVSRQELVRGQVLLHFHLQNQVTGLQKPTDVAPRRISIPDDSEVHALIDLLPANRRQQTHLQEMILSYHAAYGAEYVKRNIHYANNHLTRNYRSQLRKALHCDHALAKLQAEGKVRHSIPGTQNNQGETPSVNTRFVEQSQESMREEKKSTRHQRIRAHIDSLSVRERSDLEREALGRLPAGLREIVDQNKLGRETLLALTLEGIIGSSLDSL